MSSAKYRAKILDFKDDRGKEFFFINNFTKQSCININDLCWDKLNLLYGERET